MTDTNNSTDSFSEEFRLLGKNLHKIINSAWESTEKAQLEKELINGINDLRNSLQSSFQEFTQTETGKRVKENLEDITEKIKDGEVEDKIRSGIVNILQMINSELENIPQSSRSEDSDSK